MRFALKPMNHGVPGGKVNILGGHNISKSKIKSVYVHVSYSERFQREKYFTAQDFRIWRPVSSFLPLVLRHCMEHVNRCGVDWPL